MWAILSVFIWFSLRGSPVSSLLIKPEMWVSFVTVRTAREFRLTFLFQLKMTELPSLKLPTWLFLFNNSIQPHSLIFFSSVVLSPNIHHDSYSVYIYSFVCKRHTYFLQLNVTFVYDSDSQGNDDTMQCMHIVDVFLVNYVIRRRHFHTTCTYNTHKICELLQHFKKHALWSFILQVPED